MSDTSDETIQLDRQNDKDDHYKCRDFVRGTCDRKFCKYKHENDSRLLNFCHDFQNNICPRQHCKFIHCTLDEVEEYKRTGEMSNQIIAEATRKNQLPGGSPICNQFKKGVCRRPFCKYRHLTKEQEDAQIMELIQNNTQRKHPSQLILNNNVLEATYTTIPNGNDLRRSGVCFDEYTDSGLPLPKRRFLSPQDQHEILNGTELNGLDSLRNRPTTVFKGYFAGNPPPPILSRVDARTLMLEEENSLLHKEIAQLKQKVSDLTATNEFLLDQNANLRVNSKQRNGTVNVPAVTLTNTQPQQQVIRTVTASVATVPVSLATVSTCNPSVSIAGCPSVSIASPAQILAPSQQILVTTNPTTQLAIANSSQAQLAIAQQNLANNLAQQAQQPQLTSQAQQLALTTTTQQLATQAQHIANQAQAQLANQQLTSQAQQLANQQLTSQLTSQAQQLAVANTPQQFTVSSVPQQLALAQQTQQMNAINTSQAIAMSNATQPMVSFPIMTQSINHALSH